MDTVVIGNLCQDPILRQTRREGRPLARFTVAVNSRRRVGPDLVERPPVFHRVVCFGQLAENVTNSLRKGMEVVAIGEWADDSYSDEQGQRRVQITMEAKTVGPTLRWATAQVNRLERRPETDPPTSPDQAIPFDLDTTPAAPSPTPDLDLTPVSRPLSDLTPTDLRAAAREIGAELIPASATSRVLRRRKKPDPEPAPSG
ncbi:MAG TPA: single-stranded DNA-binding protein [Pseudonocardiaceae bacterium]